MSEGDFVLQYFGGHFVQGGFCPGVCFVRKDFVQGGLCPGFLVVILVQVYYMLSQ